MKYILEVKKNKQKKIKYVMLGIKKIAYFLLFYSDKPEFPKNKYISNQDIWVYWS